MTLHCTNTTHDPKWFCLVPESPQGRLLCLIAHWRELLSVLVEMDGGFGGDIPPPLHRHCSSCSGRRRTEQLLVQSGFTASWTDQSRFVPGIQSCLTRTLADAVARGRPRQLQTANCRALKGQRPIGSLSGAGRSQSAALQQHESLTAPSAVAAKHPAGGAVSVFGSTPQLNWGHKHKEASRVPPGRTSSQS